MIPRVPRASRLLLLALMLPLSGCAISIAVPANVGIVFAIPVLFDDGRGRMSTAGGYYDTQWFSDPDSHPAVRPKPQSKVEAGAGDGAKAP